MPIEYFIDPNPLKSGGYRSTLLTGHKASLDDFLQFVEQSSTVSASDALAVTSLMADWVERQGGDGRAVDFGALGQTRLGMKANIKSATSDIARKDWDLTIGWQVSRKLTQRVQAAAKKSGLKRATKPTTGPAITQVQALPSKEQNVYSPGGVLHIHGTGLKFDLSASDEGIFFKPKQDGPEIRCESYLGNFPENIQAIVPADLSGNQELIVRTRKGRNVDTPFMTTFNKQLKVS